MTDEQQTPAPEAGDEAVREDQTSASEATENTEGQTDDQPADPDGAKPEGEEVSASKARRERRKAEMQRLREEADAARRAKEEAEARRDKIKAQAEQSSTPPKESSFTDYNEYLIALGAYQAARGWDERQSREAEEQVSQHDQRLQAVERQRQAELAQEWAAQVEDAQTRYADFDRVVNDPNLPIAQHVAGMIQTADNGADLAYYLGTHRDEAARISQMPPMEAARALGRIEARLSLPKPKTTTETPDPIDPVRPKATAAKDPSKMSMAEYRKWRGL